MVEDGTTRGTGCRQERLARGISPGLVKSQQAGQITRTTAKPRWKRNARLEETSLLAESGFQAVQDRLFLATYLVPQSKETTGRLGHTTGS